MARPTSPSVSVSRRGAAAGDPAYTVLSLRGDHDIATMVSVAVGITSAAHLEDGPLLVDLSGVTFMDASTVGAIVVSRNQLRSHGQSLEVSAPSPSARRILDVCGLGHLVHLEPLDATGAASVKLERGGP